MRFLGVGSVLDLGSLYLRLIADGHEVRAQVTEPLAGGTLAGLCHRSMIGGAGSIGFARSAGTELSSSRAWRAEAVSNRRRCAATDFK
jgi:hypothetical protein